MKKVIFLFLLSLIFSTIKSQSSYTICAGSSINVQAINPLNLSNPAYSLQPGGLSSSNGNFTLSPTTSTSYSLYTTGLDTSNTMMTSVTTASIIVNTQPIAAPTITQATCTNSLISFNLNLSFLPNPTPFTIYWSTVPNGIVNNSQTSLTATNLSPGPYSATISTPSGCSTIANFTINPIPAPANFQILQSSSTYTLNCYQTNLNLSVSPASNSYTWTSNSSTPITGTTALIIQSTIGSWTVLALNPVAGCTSIKTFSVFQNFTAPISIISSTLINISCSQTLAPTLTVSGSPSVNVSQSIYSPLGGTFSSTSYTAIYSPGTPGTYTSCLTNTINGCSTCKTFTVTSITGFPTYSIVSPQNFTLGCSSKSFAVVQIINASSTNSLQIPNGGAVSYTLLNPGNSTITPSGTLSTISSYTINTPGMYTVITKDNSSLCESRTPISITQNNSSPIFNVNVPTQILNCNDTLVYLRAITTNTNTNINWSFMGIPSNPYDSMAVTINTSAPTSTLINSFTVSVFDNTNFCQSATVIPMYQNIFPPHALISYGGISAFTCITPSIILVNQSSTGIPANTGFPTNQPVIGFQWFGPTPQQPLQNISTYTAYASGVYTLEAKDLNNGCKSQTTISVYDNRVYPHINMPGFYFLPCPGTVELSSMVSSPPSGNTFSWTSPPAATISSPSLATITTNSPGYYYVLVTNTITGCASTASTVVQACVGLNDKNQLTKRISIFPNPNNGIFKIQFEQEIENGELEIFNSLGQMVKTLVINTRTIDFNLENLKKGLYVITFKEKNILIASQKLILN